MAFIVSARKYRPTRFDEVVGQRTVSTTLKNAIKNGKVAQSFLFCGPRGVGKTTCARILAKALNCSSMQAALESGNAVTDDQVEPCGTCNSCKTFQEQASLNIFELDAASNNSVEDIRKLIEQVRFAPQSGRYKIYIIDEVHMLSQAAFNAFLKTLEEPPHYAIFILATTEKHKIIPTILSRCQIFDFGRVAVADIVEHLKYISEDQGITAEEDGLHVIAQKADGGLRDSLSIFDRIASFSGGTISYQHVLDSLHVLDYDHYFKLTDALLAQDSSSVLLALDQILKDGFEGDHFLMGLCGHFRDLLVCKNPRTLALLEVSPKLRARYGEQCKITPTSFLLSALQLANECMQGYRESQNKRLQIELVLLKMCHITNVVDLAKAGVPTMIAAPTTASAPSVEKKSEVVSSTPPKATTPPSVEPSTDPAVQPGNDLGKQVDVPEAPAKAKSLLRKKPKSKDGLAITSLGKLHENQRKEQEEAEKNKSSQPKEVIELTDELLTSKWAAFTAPFDKGSTGGAILKRVVPKLDQAKHQIRIELASTFEIERIKMEAHDFLQQLKTELNNPNYRLEMLIDPSIKAAREKERKAYTPKEKYEEMYKANPKIKDLVVKFGLELDH